MPSLSLLGVTRSVGLSTTLLTILFYVSRLCSGAHSPDEQVRISTVLPFWEATLDILHQLARRQ